MGGRKEVLFTPAEQILKYFDMKMKEEEEEMERERSKMWINYLTQIFTQPTDGNESYEFRNGRKQFLDIISPRVNEVPAPKKEYKWDFELTDEGQVLLE